MKKYVGALFVGFSVVMNVWASTPIPTLYQSGAVSEVGDTDVEDTGSQCLDLKNTLKIRSKDATTNNEVTALQEFLQDSGLLNVDPNGYFGNATLQAVKTFQKQNGLIASGIVGSYTRKAVKDKSCNPPVKVIAKNNNKNTVTSAMVGPSPVKIANSVAETERGGVYVGYINDTIFNSSSYLTKQEALAECMRKALASSGSNVRCTWEGNELYSSASKTSLPTSRFGESSVVTWKRAAFTTFNNQKQCSGERYVGYSERYAVWVGAELCGTGDSYKLYMSDSEQGTYYQIADTGGHGQDHCELVNKNFSIPNDDDIASGTCKNCSLGEMVDVQDEPVYVRSKIGESFKKSQSTYWADLTTKSYSCGVVIGGVQTNIPRTPSLPQPVPSPKPQPELPVLPSNAELHVIGVYEASSDHSFCHSGTGQVSVKVSKKSKPIILALSSYEPVNWNITLEQGAVIERVILGGYDVQSVSGIPSSVPISAYTYYSLDRVTKGLNSAGVFYEEGHPGTYYHWASRADMCPKSAAVPEDKRISFVSGSEYYYSYEKNGEGYAKWVAKLKALTGLDPMSFQGKYNATTFTVPAGVSTSFNDSVKGATEMVTSLISKAGAVAFNAGHVSASSDTCTVLARDLHRGDESSVTAALQKFLIDKGLLTEKATGFFGDLTIEAVKSYQKMNNLPVTGMVYGLTRDRIKEETCNTI